jgi:hypothetical protein
MTDAQARELTAMIFMLWEHARPEAAKLETWARILRGFDYASTKEAIGRLVHTNKFVPAIAEIRAVALDIEHGPQRTGAEAWGAVCAEIRRVGSYESPRFADPGVTECVRLMDWRYLCLSENEAADRARFIELYDNLQTRARQDLAAGRALPPARGFAALPPPKPRREALAVPWKPKGLAVADVAKRLPPAPFDAEGAQHRAEAEQERQRQMARELLAKESA